MGALPEKAAAARTDGEGISLFVDKRRDEVSGSGFGQEF